MKQRKIMAAAAVLAGAFVANADITINFPAGSTTTDIKVEHGYISRAVNAKPGESASTSIDDVKVVNGKAVVKTMPEEPAQYVIPFGEGNKVMVLYTMPGDDINVDILEELPLKYTATGAPLMSAISKMDQDASQYMEAYMAERKKETPSEELLQKYADDFGAVFKDYVKNNPGSPAAAYAMLQMDGDEFEATYELLTPEARKSPLMPYVEKQKAYYDRQQEMKRKMMALQSGTVDAPAFTFQDRNGKDVSLSDFKGKWVIIDFWGSWCRWCIKGFPSLKEAYAKYQPELEVIGVACRDNKEAWLAALDKYQLPWVNVWNPDRNGGALLEEYAVQGFPTKAIIDPQGKIRNITVGDNPEFYTVLAKLLEESKTK